MIYLAHSQGTRVLLDGAQTVGALPLNFRELRCDFMTGSTHKWLCGPKGTGVLVIRRDRLDELTPRYVGGGSLADLGSIGESRKIVVTHIAVASTAIPARYAPAHD